MQTNLSSERLRREQVGPQTVFLPTRAEWTALSEGSTLDGVEIFAPESITGWFRWLETYGSPSEASLGLFAHRGKWIRTSLLRLEERYLQVHFEDVVCEHCGRNCGLSATPRPENYFDMSYTDAWKEFDIYPVLPCPHCGGMLRRRQTFWLAERQQT